MVRWRLATTCVGLVVSAVCLAADEFSVTVAPGANLSAFQTFAVRAIRIDSRRPELDNPLFAGKLSKTIRMAFVARGLSEATVRPDIFIDCNVAGEDFAVGVPTPARGIGPQPVRFTEGTVVIDLVSPGDPNPVWRGVYRDEESTGSKLMRKLPEDAKKLIERYPRRKT